eukprot:COSAG06_NODE_23547_length_688_cov_1.359932_1_plen_99_part_10
MIKSKTLLSTGNSGWDQDVMDAALLGLPGSESAGMIAERAAYPPALGYRWVGFQSGLACGGPCTDHMGVTTAALRYMLIQTSANKRLLFLCHFLMATDH